MTNDNDTTFQELAEAVQEIDRLKAENARLAAALYKMGSKIPFPEIRAGNAEAMAYHTGRNDHYCGMPALALVAWLQSLAKQLRAFDSVKAEAANHYSTALRDLLAPTVELLSGNQIITFEGCQYYILPTEETENALSRLAAHCARG